MAIELLVAVQAFEYRRPLKSSEPLEAVITELRSKVPFLEEDRLMHDDITIAEKIIQDWIVQYCLSQQ